MSGGASGALVRGALDYLLNCAWQAPLVALAAVALATATRLSLRGRCLAFAGALVLLGAAPLVPVGLVSALAPAGSTASIVVGTSSAGAAPPMIAPIAPIAPFVAEALVAAAGLAVAFAAARLATGWASARRLVRRSSPLCLPEAAVVAMGAFLARRGRPVPKVRTCDGLAGPAVVGAWAPVVLVPPGFEALPIEHLVAALLHECAHVARRDYALNLLCETLALPSSWHPASALLRRRLRAAREAACDQLAATALGSPARYARCLLELARTVEGAARLSSPALQLLGRGELEDRIRRLTGPAGRTARLSPLHTAGALALALGCIAPLSCLHLTPMLLEARPAREVARVAVFDRTAHAAPMRLALAPPPAPPSPTPHRRTSTRPAASSRLDRRAPVQLAVSEPSVAPAAASTAVQPAAAPVTTMPVATAPVAVAPAPLAVVRLDEGGDIGRIVFAVEIGAAQPCLAPSLPTGADHAAQDQARARPDTGEASDFDPFAPVAPPAQTPAPTAATTTPMPAAAPTPACLKAAALRPVRRRGLA